MPVLPVVRWSTVVSFTLPRCSATFEDKPNSNGMARYTRTQSTVIAVRSPSRKNSCILDSCISLVLSRWSTAGDVNFPNSLSATGGTPTCILPSEGRSAAVQPKCPTTSSTISPKAKQSPRISCSRVARPELFSVLSCAIACVIGHSLCIHMCLDGHDLSSTACLQPVPHLMMARERSPHGLPAVLLRSPCGSKVAVYQW